MKKILKIAIILGAVFVIALISMSGPSDLNLNCPKGWEPAVVAGEYGNINDGGHLRVSEVNNEIIHDWSNNNSEIDYSVSDCSGNRTMFAYKSGNYNFGVLEVIEVNRTYYMFDYSYTGSQVDDDAPDVLKQFNELNNLEPIAV